MLKKEGEGYFLYRYYLFFPLISKRFLLWKWLRRARLLLVDRKECSQHWQNSTSKFTSMGREMRSKGERDNVKALKKYFCLGGGRTQNNASLNFLLWRVIEKKKKGRRGKGKTERREGGRKIKKIKWLSITARKQEGEKVGKKKVIYGGTTLSPCFSLAGPLIFLPYYLPKPKCLGHNWNSWKGSGGAKVLPSVDAHWGNNICNSVGPGVSKL